MRLIPKAKAVRIRIKSGGEEHSSLDSLKKNFDVSDVRLLLDGRLLRWLRQQGEHELASSIEAIDKQILDDNDFALCKLFFSHEIEKNNKIDIYSFAKYCLKELNYRKTGVNLLRKVVNNDVEIAKDLYVISGLDILSTEEWISVFSKYQDNKDPDVLYYLGRLLYESKGNINNGVKFINMAVDLKLRAAIEYKREMAYIDVDKERIKMWIENNWDSKYKKQYLKSYEVFNEKEKNLILFVCSSYQIAYRVFYNSVNEVVKYANWQYRDIDYIPEMTLVKAMVSKKIDSFNYLGMLNEIKDKCKLAEIEYSSVNHPFKNITTIPKQIEYIVKHFLDD